LQSGGNVALYGGIGLAGLAFVHLGVTQYIICSKVRIKKKKNFQILPNFFFICPQLKEITDIARTTSSDGDTTVSLTTTSANTIINSNRKFVNSFADISTPWCFS